MKKLLLGLGSLAAVATPVVAVISCGSDDKKEVTPLQAAQTKAKGFINGLTYPKQDDAAHDATKFAAIDTAKQAALTAIAAGKKVADIEALATSLTEGTEVVKVLAAITAYTDSTVVVTDADGAITLKSSATIGSANVTSATSGSFTVTVPNGTAITTADVIALFDGKGTLSATVAPTYDQSTAGAYTFTITDPGTGTSPQPATATLVVTVNAAAVAVVNGAITLKSSATIGSANVTSATSGSFTVTVPNGTAITTADVIALFDGKGTLSATVAPTYDQSTAGAYTFTITDPGTGTSPQPATATLVVTVNAAAVAVVNGAITLKSSATIGSANVTSATSGSFTVTVPNGTAITTADVIALFDGKGTLSATVAPTYDQSTAGAYTFTITDPGTGTSPQPATATLVVTVNAAAVAVVNGAITLKSSATIGSANVTSATSGSFTVTVPNGTAITTADVIALFDGKGTLSATVAPTYDQSTAGAYTFTITDPGTGTSPQPATATLVVTVNA